MGNFEDEDDAYQMQTIHTKGTKTQSRPPLPTISAIFMFLQWTRTHLWWMIASTKTLIKTQKKIEAFHHNSIQTGLKPKKEITKRNIRQIFNRKRDCIKDYRKECGMVFKAMNFNSTNKKNNYAEREHHIILFICMLMSLSFLQSFYILESSVSAF